MLTASTLAPLLYNLLQLGVDAWALRRLRDPAVSTSSTLLRALLAGLALGLVTSMLCEQPMFGVMRIWCFTLFVHAPVVLLLTSLRRRVVAPAALAAVLIAVAVDAFLVEPRWLEVTTHRIETDKLTEPVRVVVLSDIQTDRAGDWERQVLQRAMSLEPDLLLLPGDYVQLQDRDRRVQVQSRLREIMHEVALSAPLGLHAVQGNVDWPGEWPDQFRGLSATTYPETRSVRVGELTVTGLSFRDSRDSALQLGPEPGFHVVFGHYPDFALGQVQAELMVAGHTHGGQVVVPFFGPPLTLSHVPRDWASGATELANGAWLVVSRGIGMERREAPRLRFLCRPQVVVVDLVPRTP